MDSASALPLHEEGEAPLPVLEILFGLPNRWSRLRIFLEGSSLSIVLSFQKTVSTSLPTTANPQIASMCSLPVFLWHFFAFKFIQKIHKRIQRRKVNSYLLKPVIRRKHLRNWIAIVMQLSLVLHWPPTPRHSSRRCVVELILRFRLFVCLFVCFPLFVYVARWLLLPLLHTNFLYICICIYFVTITVTPTGVLTVSWCNQCQLRLYALAMTYT